MAKSCLPKDHCYYQNKEDYFNCSLYASKKIRAFYHNSQDAMRPRVEKLAHAQAQFVEQERETQAEKAQAQRAVSQQRLQRRKLQRQIVPSTQLETASQQKPMPDNIHVRSASSLLHETLPRHCILKNDQNAWNMLDDIPLNRLKKLIPRKEMEHDRGKRYLVSVEMIQKKLVPVASEHNSSEEQRSQILSRHQEIAKLEFKAGIRKTHLENVQSRTSTPFGQASSHHISHLIQRLSRPKTLTQPSDQYNRLEFRGMPYVTQTRGWRRLVTKQEESDLQHILDSSLPASRIGSKTQVAPQFFADEQITEWMQELDTFTKFHKRPPPPSASQCELVDVMHGTYAVHPPRP